VVQTPTEPSAIAKPVSATRSSKPVSFPLDHAPDDPGPSQSTMDDSRADARFRLFN
jgi:hypothetical protein